MTTKPRKRAVRADNAPRMQPKFTMRKALTSPDLFGPLLAGSSWDAWRCVLIAAMGEPLTATERELFHKLSGRPQEPGRRIDELVAIVARRGGKSRAASILIAYLSACCTYNGLAPGEKPRVLCLAQNREQAAVVLQYVEGIFNEVPLLTPMIVNRTAESISLSNGVNIEVRSASFRGLRGVTSVAVIADECAFWYDDASGSANSDAEILGAVRPSLATTGGPLIMISSPHGKSGELYAAFKDHFGEKGDPRILVVNGATRDFNPLLPQEVVDRALARDYELNKAEYLGLFRDDITNFVNRDILERAVVPSRFELQPVHGVKFCGFVDAAGGTGRDSFTMAIAHRTADNKVVLDLVREFRPIFSPAEVIKELVLDLQRYGIEFVHGDRWGSELLAEQFKAQGIGYRPSDKTKSDLYLEFLPMLNSGQLELLDNPRMINQFANLERTTARGGKSTVDHPRNGHDDIANACAGAIVNSIPIGAVEFVFGSGGPPEHRGPDGTSSLWSLEPIPEGVTDHLAYRREQARKIGGFV
jgi:hypothetical protein